MENDLRAGDSLPAEGEIVAQLGGSRNSVREAVKALTSVGVIESRRGSGLFVQEFSLQPLLDNLPYAMMSNLQVLAALFEIRHILEMACIGTAMRNLRDD